MKPICGQFVEAPTSQSTLFSWENVSLMGDHEMENVSDFTQLNEDIETEVENEMDEEEYSLMYT